MIEWRQGILAVTELGENEALQWRHNELDDVSNHRRLDYLLNRFFRCRSKKTSKVRVTGLWAGNSPVTGEFRGKCFHLMTPLWSTRFTSLRAVTLPVGSLLRRLVVRILDFFVVRELNTKYTDRHQVSAVPLTWRSFDSLANRYNCLPIIKHFGISCGSSGMVAADFPVPHGDHAICYNHLNPEWSIPHQQYPHIIGLHMHNGRLLLDSGRLWSGICLTNGLWAHKLNICSWCAQSNCQVALLPMSRQQSCRDMRKIVTWLQH